MRLPVFRPVHLIILHEQAGAAAAACVQKDRAPILRQQIQVVVVVLGSAVGGGVAEYEADHCTDPVLDLLMQHKRAWMDANGITAYMK